MRLFAQKARIKTELLNKERLNYMNKLVTYWLLHVLHIISFVVMGSWQLCYTLLMLQGKEEFVRTPTVTDDASLPGSFS